MANLPIYYFGNFSFSNTNGLGFFLTGKNIDAPVVRPTTSTVARYAGTKRHGVEVGERAITLTVKVVGSSRADLESRIDTLLQALSLQQQPLCIHSDSRVFPFCDATATPVAFKSSGGVVQVEVQISIVAYDPFAYAPTSSSYDSGNLILKSNGSLYTSQQIVIAGGGTAYSYPSIRLTNNTPTGNTNLTSGLTSGFRYSVITVNPTSTPLYAGDTLVLLHGFYPSQLSQNVTVAQYYSAYSTNINVNSFVANGTYSTGDSVSRDTHWTSIQVTQITDSYTVSATIPTGINVSNSNYVDVRCDQSQANGWQIAPNGTSTLLEPIGSFSPLQPTPTIWQISIGAVSNPSAQAVWTWTPRYLN